MPPQVRPLGPVAPGLRTNATYTVKAGDSLWSIAARTLGGGDRWREIYNLNRGLIGDSPADLRVGTVLRLPGGQAPNRAADALPDLTDSVPGASRPPAAPANPPAQANPPGKPPLNSPARPPVAPPARPPAAPPAKPPASPRADSDGDGIIDRYDRSPRDARDKRWNQVAAREFGEFASKHARALQKQGVEVDCADFAVKLLEDFAKQAGLPNPFAGRGKWSVYTPERTGGLPNVNGPNWFRSGLHADNLAKEFTRRVNDANGDGDAGFTDGLGNVDTDDLRPGDILFYDWDGDGEVNHTVNILDVADDGTVTIAFGTYDNLAGENKPLTWSNLDLAPIEIKELKPGTADWLKYLGPLNRLWGARRYSFLPDEPAREARKPVAPAARPDLKPVAPAARPDLEPVVAPPAPVPGERQEGRHAAATSATIADLRLRLAEARQFLLGA